MKCGLINFHLFLLLLTCSLAKHKNYGGKYASRGQFPFVTYLTNGRYYCGASIIHERWVLTAGHCIHDDGDEAKTSITVGTVRRVESGTTYNADKFYKHPDLVIIPEDKNNGLEYVVNDIGLIRLASNISFNDNVQPIALAKEEDGSYENSIAAVPGWGSAGYDKNNPIRLRYINVRVLTHKECRRVWTYADKHICTSTKEHQGSCYGDSGSPLVVAGKQIGITSTVDTYCESLKPDLYTKVASFIPWIKSIMSQQGDVLSDT